MGCLVRPRRGGRRSFHGARRLSLKDGPTGGAATRGLGFAIGAVFVGGAAAPGVRPGRLSVRALRRPPADRGGAHGGRASSCLARAAWVRDRLAIRGAVALAAATGSVADPDIPSRQFLAPTDPDLSVRRLPPSSFWRLRRPAS